jgi:phosphoribosylglycinamide formyltransferase 1
VNVSSARPAPALPRLGVLASGSGTILAAILDAGLPVSVVASDRPCPAVELAEAAGVPAIVVERESYGTNFNRTAYTARLAAALEPHRLDVVAMAGFGTVLDGSFFSRYPDRVLNTHPALLPAFRGWHAVADAMTAGVKVTGCTVHVATEAVDDGPILAQEAVPVLPGDTVATLHERIKSVERRLYPATIREFLERLAATGVAAGMTRGVGW